MDWSKVLPTGESPRDDKTMQDFFSTMVSSLIEDFETLVQEGTPNTVSLSNGVTPELTVSSSGENIIIVDAGISGTDATQLALPDFGGQSFQIQEDFPVEISHPVIKQVLERVDAVEVSLETTVDELAELRDQLEGLQKLMRHVLASLGDY